MDAFFSRNVFITFVATSISVVLCTLGFAPSSVPVHSIATMWPGTITQAVVGILFGGWGVVITVLSGIIVDIINVGKMHVILGFIPSDFVQAFIPALYYRRFVHKYGWNSQKIFSFKPFLIYAVVLPNVIGALLGATVILHTEQIPFWHSVMRWLIANIPLAVILAWPLLKTLGPVFVEEKWVVTGWWR